jgi:hypothetical protein
MLKQEIEEHEDTSQERNNAIETLLNCLMVHNKEQDDELELVRIENELFAEQVLELDEQVQNQKRLLEAQDQQLLLALTNQEESQLAQVALLQSQLLARDSQIARQQSQMTVRLERHTKDSKEMAKLKAEVREL